jgi:type II secretory pathway pseudopilin PulG
MRARLGGEGGFTLVEMIGVCVILGIVMAGLTTVFVSGSHSQLRLDRRLQAQQTARIALQAIRSDVHAGCAVNVTGGGTTLKIAFVPSAPAGQPALDSTDCGASSDTAAGYSWATWCTVADSTGGWSLYRTEDSATCDAATGTLEGEHFTSSTLFSTASTIAIEQYQTVAVNLPVLLPGGTGDGYTLGQSLALGNGVYQVTSSTTACPTASGGSTCTPGPCPVGQVCYPPAIQ